LPAGNHVFNQPHAITAGNHVFNKPAAAIVPAIGFNKHKSNHGFNKPTAASQFNKPATIFVLIGRTQSPFYFSVLSYRP
jgi:hypothetical protein